MSETREVVLGEEKGIVVGGQVARYRLLRQIGRGGMSEVYEAVRDDIGLHVALKLLAPSLACDPQMRRRFLGEAQHLSKLDHPGLVKVIDFGAESENTTFLAMELLVGESLRERLDRQPDGKLASAAVLRLSVQLASALSAAHRRRVVHRDLKPENLMLVPDPAVIGQERLKVLDFGIARSFDGGIGGACDSLLIGTPPYMSPEQFCGGSVDPSADVYSLGIVIYEVLTGEQPFRGTLEQIRQHHLSSPGPLLSQRCPDAQPALVELLARMLAKRPEQRPTMAQVETDLEALLNDAPTYRSLAHGERLPQKPRLPARLASALLMMSMVGTLGWTLTRGRTGSELAEPGIRGMTRVKPGHFLMGSTQAEVDKAMQQCQAQGSDCRLDVFERELPQRAVEISAFQVDSDLVSNSMLVRYLNSIGPKLRVQADKETGLPRFVYDDDIELVDLYDARSGIIYQNSRFATKAQHEDLPAELVTWNGAVRFCQFAGKRLLTEAQWEYLGTLGRDGGQQAAFHVTPGLGEWVIDQHATRYPACAGSCRDPVNGTLASDLVGYRAVRGCAHGEPQVYCRPTARGFKKAAEAPIDIGFRCASP